ncbi:hypothetical protein MPSEU_001081100 [Mayamaea pseudoterrestris]|nr:hypothetical protein MPSEU_001081100 [Mayamaea pseudoterrestris]
MITMRSITRLAACLLQATLLVHCVSAYAFQVSRRDAMKVAAAAAAAAGLPISTLPALAAAADASPSSVDSFRSLILQAQHQLDSAVPDLIQKEQWDSIRAIILTPPLSDLFKKPNLLGNYAALIGDAPNGDELSALQAREDLQTHLRFLDMAVYNNVFNPIKSMGENGATKQLVASYYEDPMREYKASLQALKDLYALGE